MGLDYGWTCGDIDKGIKEAKEKIEDHVRDILYDVVPLWEGEKFEEFVESQTKALYDRIEEAFEYVRSTNDDMRKAADRQIDDLEEKVSELEETIKEKDETIESLESDVEDLNEQLND